MKNLFAFKTTLERSSLVGVDFRLDTLTNFLILGFCFSVVGGQKIGYRAGGILKALSHSAPRCQFGFVFWVHEMRVS